MAVLNKLKDFLYRQSLRKYRSTNLAKASPGHFKNIRSVGIIFDAMEARDRDVVLDYARTLKEGGIAVDILGYFNTKIEGPSFKVPYFDIRGLNFAGIPTGEHVHTFIQKPFDVLINLDQSDHKAINYVCAASQAIFKCGPAHGNPAHYDLMVAMQGGDLKAYLDQIRITFNKISG